MEQHKILLIIVSVCLFFAAVIGLGLWLFYPRAPKGAPAVATGSTMQQGSTTFDPIEYLRGSETQSQTGGTATASGTATGAGGSAGTTGSGSTGVSSSAQQNTQSPESRGDVIIVYGQQPSATAGSAAAASQTGMQQPGTAATQGPGAAANAASSKGGASGTASPGSSSGAAPAGASSATAGQGAAAPLTNKMGPSVSSIASGASSSGTASGSRSSTGSATGTAAANRAAAVSATRAAASAAVTEQYWIQLIASTRRDTVEAAQKVLQEHNLDGRITTVNVGDVDYFRLRVGPYENKSEAEKFLGWIKEISGFDGSYISEVASR